MEWLHDLNLEPVECYLRVMAPLNDEIRQLSLELKHLGENDGDVRLLMTVPGVGYYTALLVKAEVGDVGRSRTGDQLCSYAGLVPSTHSSGGVTRHGGITKEGSRRARGGARSSQSHFWISQFGSTSIHQKILRKLDIFICT